MDDRDVIRAFITDEARQGLGPSLHIERDGLLLDGWWHAAFRVAPGTFIVRTDEAPDRSAAAEKVAEELTAQGLVKVGEDLPLVTALTYGHLSLGSGVGWALWSSDATTGHRALADRLSEESSLDAEGAASPAWTSSVDEGDLSSELEGARRTVGLAPTVVVAVGLSKPWLHHLQAALPACRFQTFPVGDPPEACSVLGPTAVVVDATEEAGRTFVMELRASACGRFLPVAAITPSGEPPPGADVGLDPARGPHGWIDTIRQLLP